jgi:hypothetical protein
MVTIDEMKRVGPIAVYTYQRHLKEWKVLLDDTLRLRWFTPEQLSDCIEYHGYNEFYQYSSDHPYLKIVFKTSLSPEERAEVVRYDLFQIALDDHGTNDPTTGLLTSPFVDNLTHLRESLENVKTDKLAAKLMVRNEDEFESESSIITQKTITNLKSMMAKDFEI